MNKGEFKKGGTLPQAKAEGLVARRAVEAVAAIERCKEKHQYSSGRAVRHCKTCDKRRYDKRRCNRNRANIEDQFKLLCAPIT